MLQEGIRWTKNLKFQETVKNTVETTSDLIWILKNRRKEMIEETHKLCAMQDQKSSQIYKKQF